MIRGAGDHGHVGRIPCLKLLGLLETSGPPRLILIDRSWARILSWLVGLDLGQRDSPMLSLVRLWQDCYVSHLLAANQDLEPL